MDGKARRRFGNRQSQIAKATREYNGMRLQDKEPTIEIVKTGSGSDRVICQLTFDI